MLGIDLKNKTAIITGATQGIGLGIARQMAKAGCHIAACGMSPEDSPKVSSLKETVSTFDRDVYYEQTDIRKEKAITQFIDNTSKKFGRIDFLLSNAGANRFTAPEECSTDQWEENCSLNLRSHWMIAKLCYPHLKASQGVVLLMTSNHAYATLPNCFPYNVSKAGITGLVKALTVEWSPAVRVVGLAPGFIETEGGIEWFESFPDAQKKRQEVIDIHPVKKLGTVDEVGAFCAFLCSPYASFMSGTTYLVDGGRSAVMQDI